MSYFYFVYQTCLSDPVNFTGKFRNHWLNILMLHHFAKSYLLCFFYLFHFGVFLLQSPSLSFRCYFEGSWLNELIDLAPKVWKAKYKVSQRKVEPYALCLYLQSLRLYSVIFDCRSNHCLCLYFSRFFRSFERVGGRLRFSSWKITLGINIPSCKLGRKNQTN